MNRAVDCVAAGSFAISALMIAVRYQNDISRDDLSMLQVDTGAFSRPLIIEQPREALSDLLGVVSQPANSVLWALLGAVLIAASLHLADRLRSDATSRHEWLLNLGLLLTAIWPWLIEDLPMAGLLVAIAAGALLLLNVPSRVSGSPIDGLGDLPIAFVAGWVLVAVTSSMGMFFHHRLGMSFERGILLGLLATALLGAWGQLRMGANVTFALALIWAMIGFAAAAAGASITISTACVLGISALVVVLVRVTT